MDSHEHGADCEGRAREPAISGESAPTVEPGDELFVLAGVRSELVDFTTEAIVDRIARHPTTAAELAELRELTEILELLYRSEYRDALDVLDGPEPGGVIGLTAEEAALLNGNARGDSARPGE